MWKRPDRQIWQGIGFALLLIWFWNENGAQPLVLLLTAAAVHEGAHLLVFRCFGVRPATFSLSPFGAVLEVDSRRLSYGAELAAVLAGPCANLVCGAVLCRAAAGGNTALFAAAGAHLVLGAFNLLPLRPLDGGRALRCALERWIPKWADEICCWVEIGTLTALGAAALIVSFWLHLGIWPLIAFLLLAVRRNRTCKLRRFGVQ